ncbi:MAG: tetratricopeptide repeat protein, partial [Pseudomonadota bacterium]
AAAESLLGKNWEDVPGEALSSSVKLVTTPNSLGHLADGYRLVRATLEHVAAFRQKTAAQPPKEGDEQKPRLPDYEIPRLLGEQLRAAVELGRWAEALALLQENPAWNARDVSGLLRERVASNKRPVGFYAAQVALHQQDPGRARRILEAQLVATPRVDAVYEAYLGLVKKEATPLLEKLLAADRYEERPLIWRARLEHDAKKWDAAIATLQQAITIDPSDGEEGRGDRMRVYAFMALAVRGKGDAVKAKFFEDVVRSIRLSETADRWFETGAYEHAITLYRQALGFFQDAYCIQSRLAVRLADEGKMDEAAEHYRRAFELMPDSFGRVESHCFGCEHVFAGEKSQGVAEQVFTTMLAARPDKPQLHYLMGYLRQQQERPAEAAGYFRRAVELDPLYLNAWDKLGNLEGKLHFTPAQHDDLQLKLLELDPGRHHASPSLSTVTDLARLWKVMAEASRVIAALPATGPLWELKASAEQLGQKGSDARPWESSDREKDFAAVLLEHRFVEALQAYLASLNAPRENTEEEDAKPEAENPVISAF